MTAALADLRRELAGLLSLIDTAELPRPVQVYRLGEHRCGPGAEWQPADRWIVRAIDDYEKDPEASDCVYLEPPTVWGGDMVPVSVAEGRRLAMAILAACEWAETHRADVPRLERARAAKERRS